jgi:uncharacterized membrane protein
MFFVSIVGFALFLAVLLVGRYLVFQGVVDMVFPYAREQEQSQLVLRKIQRLNKRHSKGELSEDELNAALRRLIPEAGQPKTRKLP